MVVQETHRLGKYGVKFDPEILKLRWEALKDVAVERVTNVFPTIVEMEQKVKAILTAANIPTIWIPSYLSFARQIFYAARRHTGGTLTIEKDALKSKWAARGLSVTILDQICTELGVT